MLKSLPNFDIAIKLLEDVRNMCVAGGFKSKKVISNSRRVLDTIPKEDAAKGIKDLDLSAQTLPIDRALGVHWSVKNDSSSFRIVLQEKSLTVRDIMSSVSSVYDHLGFAAPFILVGKQLLQQLCCDNNGWDIDISKEKRNLLEEWREELPYLEKVKVKRCFKPKSYSKIIDASIHHFADACNK